MNKTHESNHFKHEVVYYVPCYQINYQESPAFTYHIGDATEDEEMAWALRPDYVLKLTGQFDAKTQPFSEEVREYNRGIKNENS